MVTEGEKKIAGRKRVLGERGQRVRRKRSHMVARVDKLGWVRRT